MTFGTIVTRVVSCLLIVPMSAWQQRQFSATADAVILDVSVLRRGQPVEGLPPEAFEVIEDGEPQTVISADFGPRPLHVTVLLEAGITVRATTAASTDDGIVQGTAGLEPDSVDVLRFGASIRPDGMEATGPNYPGRARLFDAIALAALGYRSADRRHVIVAVGDLRDHASILDLQSTIRILSHSGAGLHLVALSGSPASGGFAGAARGNARTIDLAPVGGLDAVWRSIAEPTGGRVFQPRPGESIGPTIRQAVDEFRARYLVTYRPTRPSTSDWRAVTVRVPGQSGVSVVARRGYWVRSPEPGP